MHTCSDIKDQLTQQSVQRVVQVTHCKLYRMSVMKEVISGKRDE